MNLLRLPATVALSVALAIWWSLPAQWGGQEGRETDILRILLALVMGAALVAPLLRWPDTPARWGITAGTALGVAAIALDFDRGYDWRAVPGNVVVLTLAVTVMAVCWPARRWRNPMHANDFGIALLVVSIVLGIGWTLARSGPCLLAGVAAAAWALADRGAWTRWLVAGLGAAALVDQLAADFNVLGLIGAGAAIGVAVVADQQASETSEDPALALLRAPTGPVPAAGPWPAPAISSHHAGAGAPWPADGYATFGQRFGAYLIDGLVSWVASIPGYVLAAAAFAAESVPLLVGSGLLILIGPFVYLVVYCTRVGRTGQFVGGRALGISLVDASTATPIGGGRVFVRGFCRVISAIPLGLGYFAMLSDPRGQTWHDRMANTVVVRGQVALATAPTLVPSGGFAPPSGTPSRL